MKDWQGKFYFYLVILLIVTSISLASYRYLLKSDFLIYAHVSCDPTADKCFIAPCEKSDSVECQLMPYKVIIKKSAKIHVCDAWDDECGEISCETNELDCKVIYCSKENLIGNEQASSCIGYE